MSLLVDRGYTKTTMSDVAVAAGIGRGTVYWHFDSKDDLFYELIAREVDRMDAGLAPLMDLPGTALDKIDLITRASFQYYAGSGTLFQAMLSVLGGAGEEMEQRLVGLMAEVYGRYNQMVADLLEAGKVEGTIRPDVDSEVVAATIVVLLDAMFLQVGFGLVDNDPKRLSDAVLGLIHRGCVPCSASEGGDDA